jgi:hypothetical protein
MLSIPSWAEAEGVSSKIVVARGSLTGEMLDLELVAAPMLNLRVDGG